MYNLSLKEFLKLSKRGNVIPVYREINADLDTPVSAFLKIAKSKYAFLLESVEGQEKIARYSFLGADPSMVFESKDKRITIRYPHKKRQICFFTRTDPLDEIKKIMKQFTSIEVKGLPRFYGGLVGYIGYDMVRFFEELPDKNPDLLGLADCVLLLADTLLVFDHVNHTIKIVSNCILPSGASSKQKEKLYRSAIKKIELIRDNFEKAPHAVKLQKSKKSTLSLESNIARPHFYGIVDKVKRYIRQGDVIQVVLSQRFKARISRDAFDIYRSLRSLNPSPYMFFLKLGACTLVGSSPEIHIRCEQRRLQIRPIAGTRPRGVTETQDRKLELELRKDEKEKAEHIMLVDLGRNDLGRVCKTGSVRVAEFMGVERYSHVMHLVSEVSGTLEDKFDIYDAFRASFPAGTVSGSPKIRAMEIIDELESTRRGPYAGCVGYFSFSHNMDTCIAIRTIVVKGRTAYIQAGAGIVADSIPQREYAETVNKAKALLEAISQ